MSSLLFMWKPQALDALCGEGNYSKFADLIWGTLVNHWSTADNMCLLRQSQNTYFTSVLSIMIKFWQGQSKEKYGLQRSTALILEL